MEHKAVKASYRGVALLNKHLFAGRVFSISHYTLQRIYHSFMTYNVKRGNNLMVVHKRGY